MSSNGSSAKAGAKPIRFRQLDALRFVFAAIVALGHAVDWSRSVPNGGLAVDFFFVLSGFVLAHYLIANSQVGFSAFAISRIARLVPLHLFTLALLALFWHFSFEELPYGDRFWPLLWRNALLLQGVFTSDTLHFNWPSWSVSSELWANLLVLFWIARRRSLAISAIIYAVGLLVVWNSGYKLDQTTWQPIGFTAVGFYRCIAGLAIGHIAYEAYLYINEKHGSALRDMNTRRNAMGFTVLELAMLAGLASLLFVSSKLAMLGCLILMPFAILTLSLKQGMISKSLNAAVFGRLGDLSYSVYLLHAPLLIVATRLGINKGPLETPLWQGFAFLGIVTLLSWPVYRYLELPAKASLRKLLANREG